MNFVWDLTSKLARSTLTSPGTIRVRQKLPKELKLVSLELPYNKDSEYVI
jgi:hypothetical protein